jgi:6-phosphofructokinase
MGFAAMQEARDGKTEVMIAVRDGKIVSVPYAEALVKKDYDKNLYEAFKITS